MSSILVNKQGLATTLTLNRPNVINALNKNLFQELLKALNTIDPHSIALVIKGAGDKGFSAGADLKELKEMEPDYFSEYLDLALLTLNTFATIPCPTIAKIHGYTLGGGLELALACDFIIADEDTTLGMPETLVGLIPGFGGEKRLSARTGLSKAKELIFTGKKITGSEAYAIKLVDSIVKKEFTDQVIEQWIAAFNPQSSLAKRAFFEDPQVLFKEAFLKWKREP